MSGPNKRDIQQIIGHSDFQSVFCNNVDPMELLSWLNLRRPHQEEVRKKNDKRSDEANMVLLERLKCEVDWKERLYRALQKADLLETIRRHLYGTRGPRKTPEKRRVTKETPLEDMEPLFRSLESLDIDNRWRDLAAYAGLTLAEVNIIEAGASAKKSMCSDRLIQELIRTRGKEITLGWLLKGLKAYGHQNVFTDICLQLDMESLLGDFVDGPPNSDAMGAQGNDDQALIDTLWDQLEAPPVAPLTEATEEEGSRNSPGLDVAGREPHSPSTTVHLHPCGPCPPRGLAGRGGNMPGRCSQTRPQAGTRAAQAAGLPHAQPGRSQGQGIAAPGTESPRRGKAEEGKADPYSHLHTGMEAGPCPTPDMIIAEERHTGQENFQPLHCREGAPHQTTASGAITRGHIMTSRFEDGDPESDDLDNEKPYEVHLRSSQDGEEQDVTALVQEMEHSSLHIGEQAMVNFISHQSTAYGNMTYSGQNAGSEQGDLAAANLDSGLSSSRSIDLGQYRQPQQPQHSVSEGHSARNLLEGIQLRSAVGRGSEDSGGVVATAALPSAFVELSHQHVMNGNADDSIRVLHHQHGEVICQQTANVSGIVEMPVPSTLDAAVALSSPTPPVLQMSTVGGTSTGICSPAGLGLSNGTSTISSSNYSPADPSVRDSLPSSLSSPSPLVPVLDENQLQEAHALSASSPLPAAMSDLPHESEVFVSASSTFGNAGGAFSTLAVTFTHEPEEESRFWSLTESISATLQSMFNSG